MVDCNNDGFKRSNRSTDRSIGRSRALISNRLGETIRYNNNTKNYSIRKQTQIKEGEEFKFIRLSKLINLCKQDKNSFEDRRRKRNEIKREKERKGKERKDFKGHFI